MIRQREGVLLGAGETVLRWRLWTPARPSAGVLLVHGLGEHSGRYEMFAATLTGRGYAVYTFDQRGHGRSEGPRGHTGSFSDLIADLEAARLDMWDRLGRPGALPLVLMGHSLGGLVALTALQQTADEWRAAVISAPWLATRIQVPPWKRHVATALDRIWPSAPFPAPLPDEALTRDPMMQKARREDPLNHTRVSPRMYFEVERAQAAISVARTRLPPTLVLIPEGDPVADPAVTRAWAEARSAEGVEMLLLPGLRHEPLNEVEREDVYRSVGAWLAQRLSDDVG